MASAVRLANCLVIGFMTFMAKLLRVDAQGVLYAEWCSRRERCGAPGSRMTTGIGLSVRSW
jgi:hypothetical protein